VFEGQFDILVNSGGGQITLHSYSAGDHANSAFGELALATGRPHAARIVARTDGMFLLPSLLCVYVFCDLRMPSPFLSNQSICVLSQPNALLHKYSQKCWHSHRQVALVVPIKLQSKALEKLQSKALEKLSLHCCRHFVSAGC